ncbi:MAG: hypothetical protein ABJE95_31860 [Byssovorax sp.]
MPPIHLPPKGGGGGGGGGGGSPPPAFQAGTYTFRLVSYDIANTRSRHEDTNFVSLGLVLNGGTPQTQQQSMGDENNGTFQVTAHLAPILVDKPDAKVVFNYTIVNAGHATPSDVVKTLQSTTTTLLNQGAAWAGTTVGSVLGTALAGPIGTAIGALVAWLGGKALGFLFADCDGPVAAEQVAFTGQDLWHLTSASATHVFAKTTHHPGTDSASGCGSNSDYTTHWTVTRS